MSRKVFASHRPKRFEFNLLKSHRVGKTLLQLFPKGKEEMGLQKCSNKKILSKNSVHYIKYYQAERERETDRQTNLIERGGCEWDAWVEEVFVKGLKVRSLLILQRYFP